MSEHPVKLTPRRWTKTEIGLLGKLPDRKVATLTGRSLAAVQTMRITNLGLPCVSGRGREWTPEEDQLLGAQSDQALAKRLDCCAPTIASRRRILGIRRFWRTYISQWTAAEDKLLGADTDQAIARKLGRTRKSVTHRRHKLGVPSKPMDYEETSRRSKKLWAERRRKFGNFVLNPDEKPWTPEEDKLLGTEPDDVLVRKLGRTFIAVSYRRQQMKIPRCGKAVRPWTPKEDKLLGTQTDVALAEQLRRSAIDVRWRRKTLGLKSFAEDGAKPWTDEELRRLGTKTDAQIARQIGRTQQAVRYKRGQLKIPAVSGRLWTNKELALLGTMRDEKLARNIGRTVDAIHAQRNNRSIPCFKSKLYLWRPEDDKILGTRPDHQIAAFLGRTERAVAIRRRGKGISIHPLQKQKTQSR